MSFQLFISVGKEVSRMVWKWIQVTRSSLSCTTSWYGCAHNLFPWVQFLIWDRRGTSITWKITGLGESCTLYHSSRRPRWRTCSFITNKHPHPPKLHDLLELYFKFVFKTVCCSPILMTIIQNNWYYTINKTIVCLQIIFFLSGESLACADSQGPPLGRQWVKWKSFAYLPCGSGQQGSVNAPSFPLLFSDPICLKSTLGTVSISLC